jgi:hypothetical protein
MASFGEDLSDDDIEDYEVNIPKEEMSRRLEIKELFDDFFPKNQAFQIDGMINTLRTYSDETKFETSENLDELYSDRMKLMEAWKQRRTIRRRLKNNNEKGKLFLNNMQKEWKSLKYLEMY